MRHRYFFHHKVIIYKFTLTSVQPVVEVSQTRANTSNNLITVVVCRCYTDVLLFKTY